VIKRNGTREPFDRNKILNGIMHSCNKRTVSVEQMEKIVNEIESLCQNSMKQEIETKEIGEYVMQKLKELDEVSYVRFASVYRQFKDIDSFMEELGKMLKEKQE
jgi:transcriptional repressor NrdR